MEPLPLQGTRIVDLTMGIAGPTGTGMMADLGAEVIKIEAAVRFDLRRQGPAAKYGVGLWGTEINRNKLSCSIDLTKPKGVELFKMLVSVSDAVVNSYTPRVMEQFGLEYEALRQVNPSIVFVAQPGFGSWGPYRNYVAVGGVLDALSGMASVNGYPGGAAIKPPGAYPDSTSGINTALATMLGLYLRRVTGTGQRIDAPMIGAMLPLSGEAIMDEILNHRIGVPAGSDRYPDAPNGAYRCQGKDRWVAISVKNDRDWTAFCQVIELSDLPSDSRFSSQEQRWQNRRALDDIVTAYTANRDAREVMEEFQARGVEAATLNDSRDVLENPQFKERGQFQFVELVDGETTPLTLLPWLMDGQRMKVRTPQIGRAHV